MVTERGKSRFVDFQKRKVKEYFTKFFGANTFTLTRETESLNVSGRVESLSTTTTSNVLGDLQFNTKLMKEYIDQGIAVTGDGVFYCMSDVDIEPNDKLTNSNGDDYRLKSQVMGETTEDEEILQGWLAIRLSE